MQTCARTHKQPGPRPSYCPGGLQPSREGEPSPRSHPAPRWSPREGRVTCWWPWGWKEKHRRPLQGLGGTRCHPIPHMRLTTVWVPGGPGSRRGHQGGLGARRKARRESCVPGRVLPPAPGFAPRFRLEPCGRGAGAEPNPEDPPQGTPRDKASLANPPQPTGQLLHTHLGRAALLPALPLAHLQHLKGAQESPGLISTQGNELGSPRRG